MDVLYERLIMERLKVYYGWAKIGNVRKKRSLSVMFENEVQGCRSEIEDRGVWKQFKTLPLNGIRLRKKKWMPDSRIVFLLNTVCSSMRNR